MHGNSKNLSNEAIWFPTWICMQSHGPLDPGSLKHKQHQEQTSFLFAVILLLPKSFQTSSIFEPFLQVPNVFFLNF